MSTWASNISVIDIGMNTSKVYVLRDVWLKDESHINFGTQCAIMTLASGGKSLMTLLNLKKLSVVAYAAGCSYQPQPPKSNNLL